MTMPTPRNSRIIGGELHHGPHFAPYAHGAWRARWRTEVMPVVWPWMTLEETGEAVPPAYTEWIGARLLEQMEAAA